MRSLFSHGVLFAGAIIFCPAPVTQVDKVSTTAGYRDDQRLYILQSFFQRSDCPVRTLAAVFLEEAEAHELDWRLLPSISFIESTGGKALRKNNLFGWKSGQAEFSSLTEAIHTVAFNLSNSRLYRNKSLDEVLQTYNPNADYGGKVKSVMNRIAPSEYY